MHSVRFVALSVLLAAAAVRVPAQPAPLSEARGASDRAVDCGLPPALAPLVDDSAAFMTVPAGEAAAALDGMRACAAANRRDGATWFRTGYLAHLHHARAEQNASLMSRVERIRLRAEGDSAMQLGLEYAPDSARFWYLWTRVLEHRERVLVDAVAKRWLRRAERLARETGDGRLLARILTDQARRAWLDYDARADRAQVPVGNSQPVAEMFLRTGGETVWNYMETTVRPIEPRTGLDQLQRIGDLTREAIAFDSTFDTAWRLRYRALVAFGALDELEAVATAHRTVAQDGWWPWLVAGYARHRLERRAAAQVAFDSALALMPLHERAYWLGPGPILPDSLERQLGTLPPAIVLERAESLLRRSAPLALASANEIRNELLARRIEADLRFGEPERGVRGMESDRGVVLVRYGPPDRVATFAPRTSGQDMTCDSLGESGQPANCVWSTGVSQVTTLWGYRALRQGFVFSGSPMFGTARYAGNFNQLVEHLREVRSFDVSSLDLDRRVRPAASQSVRLRGTTSSAPDSLVLLVGASLPLAHVLDDAAFARVPMIIGSAVTARPDARFLRVDSLRERVNADGPTTLRRQWRHVLDPAAPLEAVRVEAFDPATGRGAATSVPLTSLAMRGRELSDLLIASRVASVDAARWPALDAQFAVGPVRADSVVLAWELYELDGAADWSYDVTIDVARRESGSAMRAIGAVLGSLRNLVRSAEVETTTDRVTIRYARERPRPADGASLEVLTLGIAALEAGTYDVRVTVRDPASGWSATRSQPLDVERPSTSR